MAGPENKESNREEYEKASAEEKRAIEIRDLGYPLTTADAETDTLARTIPGNPYYVPE